ncbi:hypothetical protein CFY87_01355 [Actinobacillus seminis]|uniref:Lipoteichoic acid synthase 1 n=1 Tax=Actinobacillus seminis TaxID=722 RepID=A0A263HEM9_9PAST|nr:alkaline phosphatase family protein [Actinobacillus seminis]OZN25883.1 hypothetical protein CFY87_01355 [Actinobacillus seminis]SUU34577.1 Lipoteichoic acid synthase 1 [Actinobacillus seminis]
MMKVEVKKNYSEVKRLMVSFMLPIRIILFALLGFFVCRLGFYIVHYDTFQALTLNDILMSFIKGVQFDSATVMLACVPMLAVLSFPFKIIHHTWIRPVATWLSGIILFVLFAYYIADISYFGEVQHHIGAEILNLSADQGAMWEIAFSSRLTTTVIGMTFLVLGAVIWYHFVLVPTQRGIRLSQSVALKWLYWVALVLLYVILFRGIIFSGRPINMSDAFSGGKLQQANLALNPAYVTYRESRNRLNQDMLEYVSVQELNEFVQQNPNIFRWQSQVQQPTGKNIVLILLESWSYKYIDGLSGGHYGVTPFMDSLISRSQVWDNYYAAGQRSIIGIQAILSSVPALQNQPTLGFGLELIDMSRIADIADQHHYRTIMMQSSERRSFHMNGIAHALGFKEYYGKEDVPLLKNYPQEQPRFGWDYDALQFFVRKLSEGQSDKPFFSFMFTGTTHEPFPKIGEEFEVYPHDSQGENGFLNTLKYSDWALQQFMQEAEKQDWYRNTIFIFSADHTLNAKPDDDLLKRFHIPLIIFTPDGSLAPGHNKELASQYDLFPSIMDLLGFQQPISTFGRSLFAGEANPFVMVNHGDTVGLITPTAWIEFNESGILLNSKKRTTQDLEALKQAKLKIQYADKLIKSNQWVLHK